MASIEKLDKAMEDLAVDSVKEAAALVASGDEPNQAIYKIATRNKLSPPMVERVVEAFNATRSIAHFESAVGEEKVASFSLADTGAVLSLMYPEPKEPVSAGTTSDESYVINWNPPVEKAASIAGDFSDPGYSPDPAILLKRAYGEYVRLQKREEIANQRVIELDRDLRSTVSKLAAACRSQDRVPFSHLEKVARGHFGDGICPLLDIVYESSKAASLGEKRYTGTVSTCTAPVGSSPFSLLQEATHIAKAAAAANTVASDAAKEVSAYRKTLDDLTARVISKSAGEVVQGLETARKALDPFPVISGVAGSREKAVGHPSAANMAKDMETELNTFDLAAERRALDTQIMLFDFLNNDDVLRHAPRHQVIGAFNEISRLAPYASENPALMRSLLRRSVETRGLDPFELKNVTELEKAMRQQAVAVPSQGKREKDDN